MGTPWQDIRYGTCVLLNRPGFTAMAIFTLAVAIGLNTAIFSLFNTLLLRPLPVQDPSSVVNLLVALPYE